MNYYIFQNPNDLRKKELKEQINKNLPNIVTDPTQADLIIVLWWDGTMLDAIHQLHHHNKPFFGVHCGTFWFLLNNVDNIDQIPNKLDSMETISEPFINVEVTDKQWNVYRHKAINDVEIWKLGMRNNNWIDRLTLGNTQQEEKYQLKGSWVLISSPIGSTGTWVNEWEAILPVGNKIIGIKGISSAPFYRKIDSTGDKIIANIKSRKDITTLIDGTYIEIPNTSKVTVQSSEEIFTLCFIKQNNTSNFENKRMQLYAEKLWNVF
jgi:NAD kinase